MKVESSLSERPERHAARRLSDHLLFEGQKQKVHSLVDKVYSRENLKLAWERVRANRGASGADRVTIGDFEANLDLNLERPSPRTPGANLSAASGAKIGDPEKGGTGQDQTSRHTLGLRPSLSAGRGQPPGAHL